MLANGNNQYGRNFFNISIKSRSSNSRKKPKDGGKHLCKHDTLYDTSTRIYLL